MKYFIIFSISILSLHSLKAQETKYSVGTNINAFRNKVYGGLQLTILKTEKKHKSRPSWLFQFNYGLFGTKNIQQNIPDTTDGALIFQNSIEMPYDIAPTDPFTYGGYYTKKHYIKNIGWNFSINKEFKINNYLFFGLGIGHAHIRDKGFLIWENLFTNSIIKKEINVDVSTIFFLSNIGYHYDFSEKWFLSVILNLYFHTPIRPESKDDKRYKTNSTTLPTLGTEQDISISINYKF